MTVQVGDVGVDYSGARPNPVSTFHNGGRFIIRYSAGAASDPAHPSHESVAWKLCGPTEITDAVAAGLDFVANSEWYSTRVTEGAAAGAADGAADLRFWRSRGLTKGAAIYVSWDAAPSRLKWSKVRAYLIAYDRALKGYYHADLYGGSKVLAWLLGQGVIRHGWRPNAGSWSNDGLPYQPKITPTLLGLARAKTPAAIWQTGNYWYGKQADENVILRTPVGSHLEAVAAAAKPPAPEPAPSPAPTASPVADLVTEAPLLIVYVDRKDCASHNTRWPGVFLLSAGRLTHIPTRADLDALRKAKVPQATLSLALYRALGGK